MNQTAAEARMDLQAARYVDVKNQIAELEKVAKKIHDELVEYMEDTGEVFELEGLGTVRLQRTNSYRYDLTAIDDFQFNRLRELQCLTVDRTALKHAESKALITGIKPIVGESVRLVIERQR